MFYLKWPASLQARACFNRECAHPVWSFSRFLTPPPIPEFNSVETPSTGTFEVAKKNVNVFHQSLRHF